MEAAHTALEATRETAITSAAPTPRRNHAARVHALILMDTFRPARDEADLRPCRHTGSSWERTERVLRPLLVILSAVGAGIPTGPGKELPSRRRRTVGPAERGGTRRGPKRGDGGLGPPSPRSGVHQPEYLPPGPKEGPGRGQDGPRRPRSSGPGYFVTVSFTFAVADFWVTGILSNFIFPLSRGSGDEV